jgi:spermidine synthase
LDSFPYVELWSTEIHEVMLVGSLQAIELDVPRIATRFGIPAVGSALRDVGIPSPAALLATWVTGREGLAQYVAGAAPVTDDRPGIEYATRVRRGEFTRVLPRILAFRTDPSLVGSDDRFRADVTQERDALLGFYSAVLHAYRGERELWARTLADVLREEPTNSYYRWMWADAPSPLSGR